MSRVEVTVAPVTGPVTGPVVGPVTGPAGGWARRAPALAVGVAGLALVAGFAVAGTEASAAAVREAGPELTRLLRAMAVLKLAMVAGAVALVAARMRMPVGTGRLAGYLAAVAAMAVGPGLMWSMTHLAAAAVVLHGAFVAAALLAWTDGSLALGFSAMVARRRAAADQARSIQQA